MSRLRSRLHLPSPRELYRVDETRLARRPRLFFGALSREDLRRHAADPRFAAIVNTLHAHAAEDAARPAPATIDLTAHDPNRGFCESLSWMAASLLVDEQPARAAATLAGLRRWIAQFLAWEPFRLNLPLSQSTTALCTVYDWLPDLLTVEERTDIRARIIAQVRLALDENEGGFTMWRGQRFAANHNWAQHSTRALAALTLWGDTGADLAPGELQTWLDDAVENFWIVHHTHPDDGAPLEGAGYQDYGLRFLLDFADHAEDLLHLAHPFYDEHLRKLAARIHITLPGNRGAVVYADGLPNSWGTSSAYNFRRLAARFRDPRHQLIAHLLQTGLVYQHTLNWRDLFVYHPDIPTEHLDRVPVHGDMPDFGLFTARRNWNADSPFLCLRCGSASAASVAEKFGHDFGEAHVFPNQGDVMFYHGPHEVLPGCNYARLKLTSNHNLVVFDGRATQAGRTVGQLGEGGAWFNARALEDPSTDYALAARPGRVLTRGHAEHLHHYLCDLGGLYRLVDERVPAGYFFADYHRIVIFLPDGALALADRIRLPVTRSFSFRLLVASDDLRTTDDGFAFSVGGQPGRITDCSPHAHPRIARREKIAAFDTPPRGVATLRAEETREAIFANVLGVGDAASRYRLKVDDTGASLLGPGGEPLLYVDWPQTTTSPAAATARAHAGTLV